MPGAPPAVLKKQEPSRWQQLKSAGEPHKPGSVLAGGILLRTSPARAVIHLGAGLLRRSSGQPGRRARNPPAVALRLGVPPLFGLAPGGVCRDETRCRASGALLPHPFTLACVPKDHRRSALCGTFPEHDPEEPPPAGVTRHPRFVEPGLSSNEDLRPVRDCLGSPAPAYLASPRSRSKRSWNNIARTCPSIMPSIRSGRQRRWNASTALNPSVMS